MKIIFMLTAVSPIADTTRLRLHQTWYTGINPSCFESDMYLDPLGHRFYYRIYMFWGYGYYIVLCVAVGDTGTFFDDHG